MSLQFTENDEPGFQAKAEYESQAASRSSSVMGKNRMSISEKNSRTLKESTPPASSRREDSTREMGPSRSRRETKS